MPQSSSHRLRPRPDRAGRIPDVVVWEADGTVDGRVGYGAAIARRLAVDGRSVSVVPLSERRLDEAELEARHHVISGGSTPASADVPWLVDARRQLAPVLERALAGGVELGGICFGAQLLAHLLAGPGTVRPHPDGMQAGLVEATDVSGDSHAVASFHYHHIDEARLVAAGAEITLTSGATPVQAYRIGDGVRGVQFHPELDPAALALVLALHGPVVAATGGSLERSLASIEARRHRWDERPWRALVGEARVASAQVGSSRGGPGRALRAVAGPR